MKSVVMLEHLEEAAERLGIKVSYEVLQTAVTGSARGGLCRVRGADGMVWRCIVDKRASEEERVVTLANALSRFDIASLQVHGKVRELIAQYRPVAVNGQLASDTLSR